CALPISVIKVKADASLKVAEFANSDAVEVGQWCVAVGNPLGLEQTVTVGVVSALGRSGIGAATIEDFIQTDASINPGNSGGPLVDLNGKVIGINTLIFNAPGSGIGFAIPANLASRISKQIMKNGKVQRPYLGITMQPVTDELARHFDLKNRDGAVVMQIAEGSPAARSDLRPMDIIRKIDDKTMKNTNDVQKHVLGCEIDREIRLEVLRNGKTKEVKVKLEQMPASYGLAAGEIVPQSKLPSGTGIFEDLGFRVQQINAEMAREMNIGKDKGLVVVSVRSESPADNGGLKSGDVIVQVNGLEVIDEKKLEEALEEGNKKKSSVLLVNRAGMPMFLVVAHPEK
ncbi:MAG: PDZ domain-containing protein, partial [Candidatus Riflebacteria bacterium]|nr:PDZ domain-containing protein [Candidatus Riflebacteria bacterium]